MRDRILSGRTESSQDSQETAPPPPAVKEREDDGEEDFTRLDSLGKASINYER